MTVQALPDLYSLIAGMRGQTGFSMPAGWSDDIGSSFLGAQAQVGSAALQSAAQMAMQDQTNRLRFAELMGADANNTPTDAANRWRQELLAQQSVQNQRMSQELGQMMGSYGGQQTLQAQGQQAEIARQRALMLGYDPSTGQRTMDSQRLTQEAQQAAYERAMRQQLQTGQQTWQGQESALDRALRESLQAGQQGWQTGERVGTQQFQTGERIGTQQFQAGESAQERELRRQLQAGELNQREQEFARTYILQQEESRRQQAELSGTMEGGGLTEAARAARAAEAARVAELSGSIGGGLTEQSRAARAQEQTQRAQLAAQLLSAPKDVFKAGAFFKTLNGGNSPTGIGQGGIMGFNSMGNRMATPGTVSLEQMDAQLAPSANTQGQAGQANDDQAYGLEAATPGTAQTTPTETGANAIGAGADAGTPAGGLPTPPPAEPLVGAGPGGPVGGGNAQSDALAQIQALLGQQQANTLGQALMPAAPVAPTAPVMAVAPVPTPQMAPAMPTPPAAPAAPGAGQVNFGSEPAGPVGDTAAMVRAGLGGLGLRTGPAGPLGWEYDAGPYVPGPEAPAPGDPRYDENFDESFDDDVDDDGTWDNPYGPYMPGPKPSFLHPYYRASGGGGGDDDDDDDDDDVTVPPPGPGPGPPPPPAPIPPPTQGGPPPPAPTTPAGPDFAWFNPIPRPSDPDYAETTARWNAAHPGYALDSSPIGFRAISNAPMPYTHGQYPDIDAIAAPPPAPTPPPTPPPAPPSTPPAPTAPAPPDFQIDDPGWTPPQPGDPRYPPSGPVAPPPEPLPEPNNVNDPNNNGPGGPVGNAASLVQAGLGDLGLGIGAGGSFVGRQPAGPVGAEVGKPIPYVNPDVYEDPQVKSMLDDIKETSRGTGAKDRRNGKEVHGGHEFGEKAAEQRADDNDQFTRVMKRLLQQHMGPGGPVSAPLMPEGGDTSMPSLQDPGSVGGGGSSFAAPSPIASVDPGTQDAYLGDYANRLRQGIGTWGPQSQEQRSATQRGLDEGAAQALGLNPEDVAQAYAMTRFANSGSALSA